MNNFACSSITDAGISKLAEGCLGLTNLILSGCITGAEIAMLAEAC